MMEVVKRCYDLIIVGAGMIGSAAAYHATAIPHTSVCLIGPAEPKVRKDHHIHGSWFDAGRIVQAQFAEETWNQLTDKAQERFRDLEREAGISFYKEVGFLKILQKNNQILDLKSTELKENEDISENWREHFPFFSFPEGARVFWIKSRAGHLNPRLLVAVHQQLAKNKGAEVIEDVVHTIEPSNMHNFRWKVMTQSGQCFTGRNVLVACGGYAKLAPLFHHVAPGKVPDLQLRTQTVAFLRLKEEEANRLHMMPNMNTEYPFEDLDGAYILPPIVYPDGNWYLKLGHRKAYERILKTLPEVTAWYQQQTGTLECVNQLARFLCKLIPGLAVEEVTGDGCVTTHTRNAQPFIDLIADGFGVAVGGNGHAGKCCDEIGRLAARLTVLDEWDTQIPREKVKIMWKQERESVN